MSSVVFILGAGASKAAGPPLMGDFLKVARELLRTGRAQECEISFRAVFDALGMLQIAHSKSRLDLRNIESVFAAFEMARTIGRLGTLNLENLDALGKHMRVVIAKTIEETTVVEVDVSNHHRLVPASPYFKFVQLVQFLRTRSTPTETVSIITFNYDLTMDFAFFCQDIPLDYCLGNTRRDIALPLLKLHGSVNWASTKDETRVFPFMLWDQHRPPTLDVEGNKARIPIYQELRKAKHLGEPAEQLPVIVPPIWEKSRYRNTLANVWQQAARELSEAEHIFVIGYSLPETDNFFKMLYALGTIGTKLLHTFWVVDIDSTVADRFKALLGPAALEVFHPEEKPFINVLDRIRGHFGGS